MTGPAKERLCRANRLDHERSTVSGSWASLEIAGRPADVYDPGGAGPHRFGVLYLHDADEKSLRGQTSFTSFFEEHRLPCVCPAGRQCWWVDRVCPEFDPQLSVEHYLLEQVVPFFQECWNLRPPGIAVLGIGMGGQGGLRLAFKHPRLFRVVSAIAPAIDYHELYGHGTPLDSMYDSKEQARQDTAIMHVPPHDYPPEIFFCADPNDPWYRGNDRLHEKLSALGVPHEADLTTETGGHSWAYFDQAARPALEFLYAGLERESRRLL
jgi:S-formylglutathione hydrolase